jgi:hypothetical protein
MLIEKGKIALSGEADDVMGWGAIANSDEIKPKVQPSDPNQ